MGVAHYVLIGVLIGTILATWAAALTSVVFFLWAFIGQRDSRARRLRISLACVFIVIAGFAFGFVMNYFVVMPDVTRVTHPEYEPPHEVWHKILSVGAIASLSMTAGLALWSILGNSLRRKQLAMLAISSVVLFAGVSAANWMLIYSIQMPAFSRYVMIENREWQTHIGDLAPDIEYVMLDGKHVQLSELRGKVVLVNFFATWCGPCLNELPHMEELWKDFAPDDSFQMVVIGRKETQESVTSFKAKNSYTFPMAVDRDATAFSKFAKEGIPRTYVISRDGTILFQSIGFGEGNDVYRDELKRLRNTIKSALGN